MIHKSVIRLGCQIACAALILMSISVACDDFAIAHIRMYTSDGAYRGLDMSSIVIIVLGIALSILIVVAARSVIAKDEF
jgi:hypothetical protein